MYAVIGCAVGYCLTAHGDNWIFEVLLKKFGLEDTWRHAVWRTPSLWSFYHPFVQVRILSIFWCGISLHQSLISALSMIAVCLPWYTRLNINLSAIINKELLRISFATKTWWPTDLNFRLARAIIVWLRETSDWSRLVACVTRVTDHFRNVEVKSIVDFSSAHIYLIWLCRIIEDPSYWFNTRWASL